PGGHPGGGREGDESSPPAAGQAAERERYREVDGDRDEAGARRAERAGEAEHAEAADRERAEHQGVLEGSHGAEEEEAGQAEEGEGGRRRSLCAQARRPPARQERGEEAPRPGRERSQLAHRREVADEQVPGP